MQLKNIIKYIIIFAVIVGAVFLVLIKSDFLNQKQNIKESIVTDYTHRISVGDQLIFVEVADTKEKRTTGLSFRASLKDGEGMLFVFDRPEVQKFWMKDMNFPIDIIWFDENQKIIYIEHSARPESYPELLGPDEKALYVLEVPAGFSYKKDIQVGDWLKSI